MVSLLEEETFVFFHISFVMVHKNILIHVKNYIFLKFQIY